MSTDSCHAQLKKKRRNVLMATAIGVVLIIASLGIVGAFNSDAYSGFISNFVRLLSEFLPPDFSRIDLWWMPLCETVAMALAATALGLLIGLPLSVCAANNTHSHMWLQHLTRMVLNILRTIPDLIWAVLLCVAFGAGAFAGMLALCLHSIGALGKMCAEHLEHTAPEPILAIQATGAHKFQIITHGILAQASPQCMDATLYRLEINMRSAIILGFIGAGGLGQELISSMRVLAYAEVSAQLLLLIALVALVDLCSSFLRRRTLQAS